MDLFKFLRREKVKASASTQESGGGLAYSATDPEFLASIRAAVQGRRSDILLNGAINRCCRLNTESIGMLPLHLHWKDEDKGQATEHPLYSILHVAPNNWQTPFEFKRLMQAVLLRNGASYAQIVWSRDKVMQLQPLAKFRVKPKQNSDWSITYELTSSSGVKSTLPQREVFVLRDLDMDDGVCGSSRVEQARDAIDLTKTIKTAAKKLFDNGMNIGGALTAPEKLSPEARAHLRVSMAERTGAENAGKWLLLEEGLKAETFAATLSDSLQVENMAAATEEIARIFGVPRPLLMMDETSWGSGIDALGLFFIQYGLAPQFVNWEQGVQRSLLVGDDKHLYTAKFNDGALLRGSKKDQADFFAKALGGAPWMQTNEVRKLNDLPRDADGDKIPPRQGQQPGASNVPSNPA